MLWNLALALREKLPGDSIIVPISSPPSFLPVSWQPGSGTAVSLLMHSLSEDLPSLLVDGAATASD